MRAKSPASSSPRRSWCGAIGDVGVIQTLFTYRLLDSGNVRNRPPGGGGLYDIGCYAIATARYVFGQEPSRVAASLVTDPNFETDRLVSANLEFPGGRHLVFSAATQLAGDTGADLVGGGARTDEFPVCDQYTLQGDAFAQAVRGEAPLEFSLADAVANMRVIDACFRAARSRQWEAIR